MRLATKTVSRRRHSRTRPSPLSQAIEPLERRTLMAASLIRDINTVTTDLAFVANVGSAVYFTHVNASGGNDLEKSDGSVDGTKVVMSFPSGSSLGGFWVAGSNLFFTLNGPDGLNELWNTDGTAPGTVRLTDLPATRDGYQGQFLVVGSTLYFAPNDPAKGETLWKSDGTVAGTVSVADLNPGSPYGSIYALTAFGSKMYFTAWDGSLLTIYTSDGTAAGTAPLFFGRNLLRGPYPSQFTVAGSTMYYLDHDFGPLHGRLWKSDGTQGGTQIIGPDGFGVGSAQILWSVGSELFFIAYPSYDAPVAQLWRTDGTDAGTIPLTNLHGVGYYGDPHEYVTLNNGTVVGSTVYFTYDDGVHGVELWKSDGTPSGTGLVADLNPGPGGSSLTRLTPVGSSLYFAVGGDSSLALLYKTDGTPAGTVLIDDVQLPTYYQYSKFPTVGNTVFFPVDSPVDGPELWKTDGTTTTLVKALASGSEIAAPGRFAAAGGFVYFISNLPDGSNALIRSDGTSAGTITLESFNPGRTRASGPSSLDRSKEYQIDGKTIFLADDGIHGQQFWKTDGTAAGTSRITDFQTAGSIQPISPVLFGGYLYFGLGGTAANGLSGLWRTDGTTAGTTLVKAFATDNPTYPYGYLSNLTLFDGALYFAANDGSTGMELWRSDGTTAGTTLVKDILAGTTGSYPQSFTVVGSSLFFVASGSSYLGGLWKTDGTTQGTVLVKDFGAGSPSRLTAFGSTLVFVADDGSTGRELYKSDGTAAGTVLIKDLAPGKDASGKSISSNPEYLTTIGSTLYFTTSDASTGATLWRSDGTAGGTTILKQFPLFPPVGYYAGVLVMDLTAVGSTLVFLGSDATHGSVPWISDGTPAGTVILKGLNPYPAASDSETYSSAFFQADGVLYLTTSTAGQTILNRTDGTPAGTQQLEVFDSSSFSSGLNIIGWLSSGLMVAMDDGIHGEEPFLISMPPPNHAPVVQPIAAQVIAPSRTLTVFVKATDPDEGQTLTYSLDAGAPKGASINPVTGGMTFASAWVGTYRVVVRVTDSGTPARSATTTITIVVPGTAADDFDGDGKSDLAVYRPSQALWIIRESSGGTLVTAMGDPGQGDIAAPGDYDGDGKTDLAVYRPSQALWIIRFASGGTIVTNFGDKNAGDIAAPGDYDGDGKTDLAVYRPSQALWVINYSGGGKLVTNFGDRNAGDIAAPGDFDGDGKTDLAVYRPSQALWIIHYSGGGALITNFGDKNAGDIAAPGDYDGDGKTDLAVYRPSQALWIINYSGGGKLVANFGDKNAGDVAANAWGGYQRKQKGLGPASVAASSKSPVPSPRLDLSGSSRSVTTPTGLLPRPGRVTTAATPRPAAFGIVGTST